MKTCLDISRVCVLWLLLCSCATPSRQALQSEPFRDGLHAYRLQNEAVRGKELQHVKFGSDATWLAARRGPWMLRLRAEGGDQGGDYPDGGCAVTAYASLTLGYTEIETQSVERHLAPGERLENVVEYRLIAVPEGTEDEGLVPVACIGVDQEITVAALAPVALKDPHGQTRQYAITALNPRESVVLPNG